MHLETVGTPILWVSFTSFILLMLVLDLGIVYRRPRQERLSEALFWTAFWIGLALIFGMGIWHFFGHQLALEYFTAYIIEKALSVDNLFIFMVIFSSFAVPSSLQHQVLFWGIIGVLILRAIFILVGAVLLQRFYWIIYPFGIILVATGFRIYVQRNKIPEIEKNLFVKVFRRFLPVTSGYHDKQFFVRENNGIVATPLFLVLLTIEFTDIIFAIDSIPAVYAVTSDPFIVYTSNIFAILGLRSLYFALAGSIDRFHYLKVALAMILIFVGVKMLMSSFYKIPIWLSLLVIVGLIGFAIILSLRFSNNKTKEH